LATFVLVDFENIQSISAVVLEGGPAKIKVFLGEHQSNVPLQTARALQRFGSDVEYIQIDGNGKNALDFHIAYYIGRLAAENPGASFQIVSKDTGFDPLVRHLTTRGIQCGRSATVSDITSLKPSKQLPTEQMIDAIVANLVKRKAGKPRTLKTLRSTIHALFGKEMPEQELDGLVNRLKSRGLIAVVDGKVSYSGLA
jgi:PIN domain